jgi:hypothetical protein
MKHHSYNESLRLCTHIKNLYDAVDVIAAAPATATAVADACTVYYLETLYFYVLCCPFLPHITW